MAIPLKGDRSAFDVNNYPSLHSSDIENGEYLYHLPQTSGSSPQVPVWDGDEYIAMSVDQITSGSSPAEHSFTWFIGGAVEVTTHPVRIYNIFSKNIKIIRMKAYAGTAPVGADIRIVPKINGSNIFTSGSGYYSIPDSSNAGDTIEDLDGYDILEVEDYFEIQITQIGSTTPGSNVTIQILGCDTS